MHAATVEKADHSRGLCHLSDRGQELTLEEAQALPPNCRCCGNQLRVVDDMSTSFQQLGMFHVICDTCP
jgi:hypothetical protein